MNKNWWGGTAVENSGYSMGVIQVDFGQYRDLAKPFLEDVQKWAKSTTEFANGFSKEIKDLTPILTSNRDHDGVKWLTKADRDLILAYGAVATNQKWFSDNIEKSVVEGKLDNLQKALDTQYFQSLTRDDQIVMATMLEKVVNQGGQGRLNEAVKFLKNSPGEVGTLDAFVDFVNDDSKRIKGVSLAFFSPTRTTKPKPCHAAHALS